MIRTGVDPQMGESAEAVITRQALRIAALEDELNLANAWGRMFADRWIIIQRAIEESRKITQEDSPRPKWGMIP